MKFIKLSLYPNKTAVLVNAERITHIEKFDQTRYVYFGKTYIVVDDTLNEIEGKING